MPRLLRSAATAVAGGAALLSLYDAVLAAYGWRAPPPAPSAAPERRFRVLVPAHDEAQVLGGLLEDLACQRYPRALVEVVVLADRCSDDTAATARRAGAQAEERRDGPPGKGAALSWHLTRRPLALEDALVVLDADTRVPPDLLERFSDELAAGAQALQAYLDVTNPDDSWVAAANALTYWSGNRMVQLARRNLGWSCDLGGTGMCLTGRALAAAGGMGGTFSEDRELTFRLQLAGIQAVWLHHVRIHDEKPADLAVAVRQRARWRTGLDQVRRAHLVPLLRHAVTAPSGSAADLAVRLVRPGRGAVVLVTAATLLLGPARGRGVLRRAASTSLAAQVLLPPVFLVRDGVALRHLARYPTAALYPLLAPAVRVLALLTGGRWFHTPHRGTAAVPRRPEAPATEPPGALP